ADHDHDIAIGGDIDADAFRGLRLLAGGLDVQPLLGAKQEGVDDRHEDEGERDEDVDAGGDVRQPFYPDRGAGLVPDALQKKGGEPAGDEIDRSTDDDL